MMDAKKSSEFGVRSMPVGHAESNDLLRNGERSSEFGVLALTRRYATKLEDLPLNSNKISIFSDVFDRHKQSV